MTFQMPWKVMCNLKPAHNLWCAQTSLSTSNLVTGLTCRLPRGEDTHLRTRLSTREPSCEPEPPDAPPTPSSPPDRAASPDPQQLAGELPKRDEGGDGRAHHPSQPLGGALNEVQGVTGETDS